MEAGYLAGLLILALLVVHFKEHRAEFCVNVAGTIIVLGILLQILRALLHF